MLFSKLFLSSTTCIITSAILFTNRNTHDREVLITITKLCTIFILFTVDFRTTHNSYKVKNYLSIKISYSNFNSITQHQSIDFKVCQLYISFHLNLSISTFPSSPSSHSSSLQHVQPLGRSLYLERRLWLRRLGRRLSPV